MSTAVTTILFTDIEGSTRPWEQRERMAMALARHDASPGRPSPTTAASSLTTGDGLYAAFPIRWTPSTRRSHCKRR